MLASVIGRSETARPRPFSPVRKFDMVAPLAVPELVRQRAISNGRAGMRWLAELPEVVGALADRWGLRLGDPFEGGTASYVAAATDPSGRACVIKIAMPLEMEWRSSFDRSVLVHKLAAGRSCAELLDYDASVPAMLLERLGPNLVELQMGLPQVLDTIAATLRSFWRPVSEEVALPAGSEKAVWLARYIVRMWERLERPCDRAVIDLALKYCEERAAAFDVASAVLVHGDAHGWNTLTSGDGSFKFVDPEGLRSEPAHDLSVPMREYNEPLLAGDTKRLVLERADLLARQCDLDASAVWEWGFIERVSTGLAGLDAFGGDDGMAFLEVARRCL